MNTAWFSDNLIELFGAVTGIIYVILEIRQITWLWPVGIITSAVYVWVFFTGKLYADMSLQVYYVFISILGWYWWVRREGEKRRVGEGENGRMGEGEKGRVGDEEGEERGKEEIRGLRVTRIKLKLAVGLTVILVFIYIAIYLALSKLTDSPVPGWDAFITSLSVIGTWMLARKIFEHWYLWIMVNSVSVILCLMRGLYPTVALYAVYLLMSFIGLYQWRKSIS
jgi:nicotinamide mononucleotide transporter